MPGRRNRKISRCPLPGPSRRPSPSSAPTRLATHRALLAQAEIRTSSLENPARKLPPAPSLPPSEAPCLQMSLSRSGASSSHLLSECRRVSPAAPGSGRLTSRGRAAAGDCSPAVSHTPPPSAHPLPPPRLCARADGLPGAIRCRCDAPASSVARRASASPTSLSARVSLRRFQGSMSHSSFSPTVPSSDSPFPPQGRSGGYPCFLGTMSCYDSSPAFSLRRGRPLPRQYRRCSSQLRSR